jgi:hypothetical protein
LDETKKGSERPYQKNGGKKSKLENYSVIGIEFYLAMRSSELKVSSELDLI